MKTEEDKIESFIHDWGQNLWEYFDWIDTYDKTDVLMKFEL